jgi:miniconductance mechanosensitive channel
LDQELRQMISQWLEDTVNLNQANSSMYNLALLIVCLVLAGVAYLVVKRVVIKVAHVMSLRSKVTWDDIFVNHGALEKFALLVPLLVIDILLPLFTTLSPLATELANRVLSALLVILLVRAIYAVLNAVADIANGHKATARLPITSVIQLLKLFLFFVAAIVIISILSAQTPRLLPQWTRCRNRLYHAYF